MFDFDEILIKLPSLKNLLDTHGSMSLFDYARGYYHGVQNDSPVFQSRKEEFLSFLSDYVAQRHGIKMAESVINALSKNYAVSTAEHHGPMGHPFFFQSTLLRAITEPELPVVNFTTSHVSLGNSSYPRGVVFHGDGEKAPKEYLHLPFFGSKYRMCPVFGLPSYTKKDIEEHCLKRVELYKKEHCISEEMSQKLFCFIQKHVLNPTILARKTYSEQITQLNYMWWKELFSEMPPSISLDAENMVVELLKKHLQEETSFSRLLTNMSLQSTIEQEFDGISCCFDRKAQRGTYLFWYLDTENKRHALWRKGEMLVGEDNSWSVTLNAEGILQAFQNNQLIPSGLLVYTLFVCYYGITCFGGFAQGEYLSQIQQAYAETMQGLIDTYSTQNPILNEDIVFLYEKNGEISTALDLYYQKRDSFDFTSVTKKIDLHDSIGKMKYEIGRCF